MPGDARALDASPPEAPLPPLDARFRRGAEITAERSASLDRHAYPRVGAWLRARTLGRTREARA